MINESNISEYEGKEHRFNDGTYLKIHQVKQRNEGLWVTYESGRHGALPLRQTVPLNQFVDNFGVLFQSS